MLNAMRTFVCLVVFACCTAGFSYAEEAAERVYELRVYTAEEGKLEDLLTRFRDHTVELFARHGVTNVGYFVPTDENNNQLVYLLSFPSRQARGESFKAFGSDADWKKALQESQKNGRLVKKIDSTFLAMTDYSPVLKIKKDDSPRLFELRTYTATEGNLSNLDARFRDHTVKLFDKHGLTNIAYFHPMSDQPGADNTLIYLIAAEDLDSRNASFKAFAQDEAWKSAKQASEENADGPLTVKGGVKNQFLTPTDFSPLN